MIKLNLIASGTEQTILKEYLENNVSETLAEKINNGIKIEKDGTSLVSKKDLTGFMKYACDEAQKQAEKGARSACIEDKVVFNWLIHYFEEDSIDGTLFNVDGTEYKSKPTASPLKTTIPTVIAPPKPKPQMSLFDFMGSQVNTNSENKEVEKTITYETLSTEETELEEDIDETEIEVSEDETEEETNELTQVSENKWVDKDGVIHEVTQQKKGNIPSILMKLFGNTLIVR